MALVNKAVNEITLKLVYYGPGLCGKTTNLERIHADSKLQNKGKLLSMSTETDRTLFFDFMPMELGTVGGQKIRVQLYTVPGQVFYNTTRKLVLKGVDGIVFVADSQRAMVDADVGSFQNLRENLMEIGLELDEIPLVIQLNKRDLPNVADAAEVASRIDPAGAYEAVPASAMTGEGVFETLKVISKLTLRTLRKRMMGDQAPRAAAPASRHGAFHVREVPRPRQHATIPPPEPTAPPVVRPEPFPEALAPADPEPEVAARVETELAEPEPMESGPAEPMVDHMTLADLDADLIAEAPIPSPPEPRIETPFVQPDLEPDLEPAPAAAPEVRRLKVRSSIDIMAELEQLRKRATQTSAARKHETTGRAKEAARKVEIEVADETLSRSRRVRVELSFEDEGGTVVKKESRTVDLDEETRLRTLTIDLGSDSSR